MQVVILWDRGVAKFVLFSYTMTKVCTVLAVIARPNPGLETMSSVPDF